MKTGTFTKAMEIGGNQGSWMVKVPIEQEPETGDLVELTKRSGETILVKLGQEVPFRTKNENRRFTFVTVDENGKPNADASARVAKIKVEMENLGDDGYPEHWARLADGSVNWPRNDSLWRQKEQGGSLGLIVRDKSSRKKVGWYEFVDEFFELNAQEQVRLLRSGEARTYCREGVWMMVPEMMEGYEQVWMDRRELPLEYAARNYTEWLRFYFVLDGPQRLKHHGKIVTNPTIMTPYGYEASEILEYLHRRSCLIEGAQRMLLSGSGRWTLVARNPEDSSIVGVLLAGVGKSPEYEEPDAEAEENFTEDGQWIDEVDPNARLIPCCGNPREQGSDSDLIIWDLVADTMHSAVVVQLIEQAVEFAREDGLEIAYRRDRIGSVFTETMDEVMVGRGGSSQTMEISEEFGTWTQWVLD